MGRLDRKSSRFSEVQSVCGNLIGGTHYRCPGCGGRRIKVVDVSVHDAHADSLYGK